MSKNILEKKLKSKRRVRKPKVKGISKKSSRKPKRVRKRGAESRSKKSRRKPKRVRKGRSKLRIKQIPKKAISKRKPIRKRPSKRSSSKLKRIKKHPSKRSSKKAPSKSKRRVSKRRVGRPRKNSVKRSPRTRKNSVKRSPRARKNSVKRSPRARKRFHKSSSIAPKRSPQPPKRVTAKAVINGLTWTGNSCYIDSLFICLLASPNTFVDRNILNKRLKEAVYENFSCNNDPEKDLKIRQQIQDELRKLTANIRGQSGDNVITCTNFRKIIRACKTTNKNLKFYGTGEQDPVEFLEYICNIFGIRFTATFNEDPIGYLAIIYPDFRAFTFDRRIHRNTTWTPPKTTRTGSNVLQLSSVITYTPGHYTCFFRIGAVWYFYNDMSNPFVKTIGSYSDLLDASVSRNKINVQTHGVLYFYTL